MRRFLTAVELPAHRRERRGAANGERDGRRQPRGSAALGRWVAGSNGFEHLRVRGGARAPWTANDEYTIEVSDTTLFAPRFDNSATQVTVLVLQNTTQVPVGRNRL